MEGHLLIGDKTSDTIRPHPPKRSALDRFKLCPLLVYIAASISLIVLMFTTIPDYTLNQTTPCDFGPKNLHIMYDFALEVTSSNDAAIRAFYLKVLFQLNPFTILLAWGPLSFATVKIIDVLWNLIVGRIGQAILGIVTYKILVAWLVEKMSSHSIPYQLVRETALSKSCSLGALLHLIKVRRASNFWRQHKLHLFLFALCVAFVLGFPTLMGAVAGYRSLSDIYIKAPNGDLLQQLDDTNNSDQILQIAFALDNGHLLGLSDPAYVWVNPVSNISGIAQPGNSTNVTAFEGMDLYAEAVRLYDNCTESCNTFHWPDGSNVTWAKGQSLQIYDLRSSTAMPNLENPGFIIQNEMFTFGQYLDLYTCTSQNEYMWGFSWHLLALWSVLNTLFVLILGTTWYRLKANPGIRRSYGVHRAVVDLATVSQDILGEEVHFMDEKEVQGALDQAKAELTTPQNSSRVVTPASNLSPEAGREF